MKLKLWLVLALVLAMVLWTKEVTYLSPLTQSPTPAPAPPANQTIDQQATPINKPEDAPDVTVPVSEEPEALPEEDDSGSPQAILNFLAYGEYLEQPDGRATLEGLAANDDVTALRMVSQIAYIEGDTAKEERLLVRLLELSGDPSYATEAIHRWTTEDQVTLERCYKFALVAAALGDASVLEAGSDEDWERAGLPPLRKADLAEEAAMLVEAIERARM